MQTCKQCSAKFEITQADLSFYEKVSPVFAGKRYDIPPPTLCPECRMRRRLTWRNEKRLYHRKCGLTGKQILSIYAPESPYTVYDHREWYTDKWDPLDYGRDFDFSRPFFEQFGELLLACPMRSVNLQAENDNCEYTNLTTRNRNCYLIFAANDNEDCYYSMYIHRSSDLIDCFFVFDSELCYECIDCEHCYGLMRSQYCESCTESELLFACRGCKSCFGCVNLANQEYCLFNQQLSKEEYAATLKKIHSSPEFFERAQAEWQTLRLSLPHKAYAGLSNENVSGDHLNHCKNVENSFDCTYLEDCANCTWLHKSKECRDCYAWGIPGELAYENHLIGNGFYKVSFSESCWNSVRDLLYCRYCLDGSKDCFGCDSLRAGSYCILNKQYTQEEYERLVPKIIEHMRTTGEWGEFFPSALSPYAYNETVAQEYFPLTEQEASKKGYRWRPEDDEEKKYMGPKIDLPRNIEDVPDEICKSILTCEVTGRPYKLIPQELEFYRKMNIPPPRRCFDQRHADRRAQRNPRQLWERECGKCKKAIRSTYAPDRPETVYCEECYLSTVY
ncbi:MAG: hypothetical protein AAB544_03790 [Patescibacteria group bacterium]